MRRWQKSSLCGIAALTVAFLAVGCSKRGGEIAWWQGEQERIELHQSLKLKQFRLKSALTGDLSELVEIQEENRNLSDSWAKLVRRKSELHRELESMRTEVADLRTTLVENRRQQAIGTSFDRMVSLTGREYRDVRIASIDDSGVTIRHAHGSARLNYRDLSPEQHAHFGLDADLAAAAVAKEAGDLAAYNLWLDERLLVIREEEEMLAQAARVAEEKLADERSRVFLASVTNHVTADRPVSRPFATVRPRQTSYYNVYRYHQPNHRYGCYPTSVHGSSYTQHPSAWNNPSAYQRRPSPYCPKRVSYPNTTFPNFR